jgi:hypothetical protein
MARVNRQRIQNILEIPHNSIFELVGRGLKGNNDDDTPKLEVDVGQGLHYEGDQIQCHNGDGIIFDDDKRICIDREQDHSRTTTFTTLSDITLAVDGCWLMINKKYTVYEVRKARCGLALEISSVGDYFDTDGVCIPQIDGYGGSSLTLLATRTGTEEKPNFYQS